ncbi:MAG: YggT family protein [Propionibacteriaceae bacterium]|nr:YggT family protein [Propionibacteriaceae bacterium]
MVLVGIVISWVLGIYCYVLFARAVLSFIPLINPRFEPRGVVLVLCEAIYSLTDPPIRLARRLVPSGPGFGGVRLDLGFLLVFLAVLLLMRLNHFFFLS